LILPGSCKGITADNDADDELGMAGINALVGFRPTPNNPNNTIIKGLTLFPILLSNATNQSLPPSSPEKPQHTWLQ